MRTELSFKQNCKIPSKAIQLADGWYRGSVGAWGLLNEYDTQTKLLAQLEVTDKAGNTAVVCTDDTWQWSNDGMVRFADNKDGEIVEAFHIATYSQNARLTAKFSCSAAMTLLDADGVTLWLVSMS